MSKTFVPPKAEEYASYLHGVANLEVPVNPELLREIAYLIQKTSKFLGVRFEVHIDAAALSRTDGTCVYSLWRTYTADTVDEMEAETMAHLRKLYPARRGFGIEGHSQFGVFQCAWAVKKPIYYPVCQVRWVRSEEE